MYIVYFGIFWLLGLWLGSQLGVNPVIWAISAGVSLLLAVFFRKRDPRVSLILACLMALSAGGVRYITSVPTFDDQHVSKWNESPRNLTITGTVVDEPAINDRTIGLRVEVDSVTVRTLDFPDGKTEPAHGKILINAQRFPIIEYGTRVEINGKLQDPFYDPFTEFDYGEVLAQEDIYSQMFLPRIEILEEGQGNPILTSIYSFKRRVYETIGLIMPSPSSSLLQAILLGDKADVPPTIIEDFRTAGLSHLLVISGFHVAIIMLGVLAIADAFVDQKWAVFITIIVLILYVLLVGVKPSVVRATLMGVSYLIGSRLLGTRGFSLGVLMLAGILMTMIRPQWVWSVGFQLSFLAVLGILLYTSKATRWMRRQSKNLFGGVVTGWLNPALQIMGMTFGAQALTIPITAWYFRQISPISLVANTLVIPAQPFAIVTGALATATGLMSPALGRIVGFLPNLFLGYTEQMVSLLARVPFAAVPIKVYSVYTIVLVYLIIAILTWLAYQDDRRKLIWQRARERGSERLAFGLTAMGAIFILGWSGGQPDGMLHVTFFDVGQGDAVFIETPSGRQILVDAGYFPSVINRHLGRTIPFMDRDIDMVIATHPDADHITGLPGVMERYEVGQFVAYTGEREVSDYYDAMLEKIEEYDIPLHRVTAGEVIEIEDGVRLEIVHPTSGHLNDESRNENSVSFRLVYGNFSMLLTGDAEEWGEEQMLRSGANLRSEVYKVGHHGSNSSSTPRFLDAVRPKIAVVSAGKDNKFGHPHPDVVARLQERGITILCTIELGSIEVITDGEVMWWEAEKGSGEYELDRCR